jgi:AbrB family looped-hinge helix DNA binding protein
MERTKLSNKGQVVIPHRIRAARGWDAGVEFVVEPIEGGIALRPIGDATTTTVDEVFGCVEYDGPKKSLQDMEEGIAKGARSRS